MRHIKFYDKIKDGSRAAATSKMESFVIIVNGWNNKCSILDVAATLDPPLQLLISNIYNMSNS